MERVAEAARELTLADLADLPRWVSWREEEVQEGERWTKVPYNPQGRGKARIPSEPSTWGTRRKAEQHSCRLLGEDDVGGIGIVLGELNDGTYLMGIDLDRCLDKSGAITPWADNIIKRFATYAEVSPSKRGIKLFFRIAAADVHAVEQLLGGKLRKTFSGDGEHREIAIDTARFYAVTDKLYNGAPETLHIVDLDDVRWFLEEAGPDYQVLHGVKNGLDESESGYGFRFLADCKRQGMDYEAAKKELLADEGKAGKWGKRYAHEKDERQLRNAWENAKVGRESIHSWEDPDFSLLDDRRGELPEFPVEVLHPEWLQDWVKRAAHGTGTTVDHVAVPLLGISSALIGTARRVEALSFTQPMTNWTGITGLSGTGKSPGIVAIKRPLDEVERHFKDEIDDLRRAHESRVEEAKAAKAAWKEQLDEAVADGMPPPPKPPEADEPGPFIVPRLYVSDTTIERMVQLLQARPRGMLLIADELAGWFHNMSRYSGGKDNQFWLMAWDGFSHSIERMGRPSISLTNLLVGIVGGIQPDKLAECFKGAADGMYARFLWSWPARAPYRPLSDTIQEVDDDIVKMLECLARLRTRETEWIHRPLATKGLIAFEQVRRTVHEEMDALDGREREWWSKVPAHVLRLAGVLAYIRWALVAAEADEPRVVSDVYVKAASTLVMDYFWPHARACLRQIGFTQRHADARKVLRWAAATKRDVFTREDARREALGNRPNSDETHAICDGLVKAGWLQRVIDKPARGRPPTRWRVNPQLFKQEREA